MARGFGSTFGVDTSDYVSFTNAFASNWSFACRFYRNGATVQRIFEMGSATSIIWSTNLLFNRDTTGTTGSWSITDGTTTGQWYSLVVTQSALNDPVVYIDGVSKSVTLTTPPTGSEITSSGGCYVGNRVAGDRVWDGLLAELCWWNVVLTANDAAALTTVSPLLIQPQAITGALPLVRSTHEVINSSAVTVTGTAVQPHPRMIYSRRHRIYVPAAAVSAAAASGSETLTVTDAATQAVGILVSAAEYSGEDTLTSANW